VQQSATRTQIQPNEKKKKGGREERTLYKASQNLTPGLQQRMPGHDLQKPLQPLTAMLDDVVAEAVREDLPRQRGDGDARALALEDVAEVLEVGVAAAHDGVFQFEGGDVCAADQLVGGVHVAGRAVGLGVADLFGDGLLVSWAGEGKGGV
jgi:hypothetical protein